MARVREKKGGWGGRREGAGRKPLPKPPGLVALRPAERDDAMWQELRRLADSDGEVRKKLQLLADGDGEVRQKLQLLAQAEVQRARDMANMREAIDRILKHQADIAREIGTVERPATPKISRRRPLTR